MSETLGKRPMRVPFRPGPALPAPRNAPQPLRRRDRPLTRQEVEDLVMGKQPEPPQARMPDRTIPAEKRPDQSKRFRLRKRNVSVLPYRPDIRPNEAKTAEEREQVRLAWNRYYKWKTRHPGQELPR